MRPGDETDASANWVLPEDLRDGQMQVCFLISHAELDRTGNALSSLPQYLVATVQVEMNAEWQSADYACHEHRHEVHEVFWPQAV
jgi:hypothetical protein